MTRFKYCCLGNGVLRITGRNSVIKLGVHLNLGGHLFCGDLRSMARGCWAGAYDLHLVDGDLANPKLPLILGHEIVGVVVDKGQSVKRWINRLACLSRGW